MKVLITGICGMIGSNLSRALIKKRYEVSGLDDLSCGKHKYLHKDVQQFFQTGCHIHDQWGDFIGRWLKFDYVIHLASQKIPRYGRADKTLLNNTRSMENAIRYAMNVDAKLIFASSSDVYGMQDVFYEKRPSILGPPWISRWSYAISKMWCEQLLYSMPENFDFRIVRLFGTYGPYNSMTWTAGPQGVFINQALKKEFLTVHGDGQQKRCFQYVDDAVDGIIKVMESGYKREVFNIGNPHEEISIVNLAKTIWNMINPNDTALLRFTEHSSSSYQEVMARIPDIKIASMKLGFEPKINMAWGLRKTIEWQKKYLL